MNCFVTIIAKEDQNQIPNPPNPKRTQNPNIPNPKLTQNPNPETQSYIQNPKPKAFGVGTCLQESVFSKKVECDTINKTILQ
jgi:hypothetical protein